MKLVFIVAGSFHLGQAGCYGNDWTATPALDGLAAEAVVFDQHFAGVPGRPDAWLAWLGGNAVALLQQAGVAIRIVSDRAPPWPGLAHWQQPRPSTGQLPFEAVLQAALHAIDELDSEENWFLGIETSTLLPPWPVLQEEPETADDDQEPDDPGRADVDEQDGESIDELAEDEDMEEVPSLTGSNKTAPDNALEIPPPITEPPEGPLGDDADERIFVGVSEGYSGAMMELDAGLEWLREQLEERGLLADMAIILTSDRGYPLGEHGVIGQEPPDVHEESVHLPLVVRLPGGRQAGRRVPQLTQPGDLLATILELFGVPVAAPGSGKSLWPLVEGSSAGWRTFTCSRTASMQALRTAEWCLLVPEAGDARLFVKPDDRWEVNDVAQHHPELVEELKDKLRAPESGNSDRSSGASG